MTSTNFIAFKDVSTFLNEVSEEIDKAYIKDYLHTQIQSQSLTLKSNSKITYRFIPEIKSYQITLFSSNKLNLTLEPYVFYGLHQESKIKTTAVYFYESFFVLYIDSELIYYQEKKDDSTKEDILNFINQTFQLKLSRCIDVSSDEFDEYKKLFVKNEKKIPKLKFIKKKNNKHALFYIFYLCVVFLALVIYFVQLYENEEILVNSNMNSIQIQEVRVEYENLLEKYEDNKKITEKLLTLFNLLDKNGIKLIDLKISQNKSDIKIKAKNKELLLDFLDFYDEDSTINNMRYIKEENYYEMYASVRLFK